MRNFGVEIEAYGRSQYDVIQAIRATGANVSDSERYTHTGCHQWKVTTDASIRGRYPFEVVSPILNGEAGIAELKKVVEAVNALGCDVNKSCGIHVHIDMESATFDQVKNIFTRYEKFESQIDAFMPRSRRGDTAYYCQSVASKIDRQATSIDGLCGSRSGCARYCKVNSKSYVKYGTIEFRQHAGSLNATKISNWVLFLQSFCETSLRVQAVGNTTPTVASSTLSERGSLFVGFLSTNFGRTRDQVMDETGLTERQIRHELHNARQAGWVIKTYRQSGFSMYILISRPDEQSMIDILVGNDTPSTRGADNLYIDMDASLKSYFETRTNILSA